MIKSIFVIWFFAFGFQAIAASLAADAQPSAKEIFERRIMPIFKSPNPSSCTECHLAGVDLKNYILPSHERTFPWLKLDNTPPQWGDRMLLVLVYAFDEARGNWEPKPVAKSDRMVWGKGKLWQHQLVLLAEPKSARASEFARKPILPEGKYRVKVFVDQEEKLKRDWQAELGDDEYEGEVSVVSSWPTGYGKMTAVEASAISKK